jgi:subtilisin family serine protease
MKKQVLLLLCCVTLISTVLMAQNRQSGQLLVRLGGESTIENVVTHLSRTAQTTVSVERVLAPRWRIFLLQYDEATLGISTQQLLRSTRSTAGVVAAQWNHSVAERNVEPNDPEWLDQVSLRQVGMPRAWENTTGGLTPAGDTIVVAVLEQGMQQSHPDLIPNLWRNWREIPANNVDDDNNGYIDDYTGLNARTLRDAANGTGSSHGTSVHGIIGARGNNSEGMSGLNWHIKMVPILNCQLESDIIAGYYYAGDLRRLYEETNGEKGAFVVVTNASFGIDNAQAAEYPLWCAVYDELGALGILSVAATSNTNVNVDVAGDMPSTCASEFLVTVTNLDATSGEKIESAGRGSTSVDMGAPGTGSFSCKNAFVSSTGDTVRYGGFGGTSAACPHVTGAVALMYAINCAGFVADAHTDPVRCTRRIRNVLFDNLRPEETLRDITTRGGRLDVAAVVEDVMQLCGGTTGELEIFELRPNPVETMLEIRYQTPDFGDQYRIEAFDRTGRLVFSDTFMPPSFEAKRYFLDVSSWIPGPYVVRLVSGKTQSARKFLKI